MKPRSKNERPDATLETDFSTPMMQQYMAIRKAYPGHLIMYRLGDFYELFLDDAEIGAHVLQITLTRRPRGRDGDIPMAGVPYHAADRYISKLVKAGYKVAICEQMSLPGKGIVEREVVRIVTPGTNMDEQSLERKENNYIMCIVLQGKWIGFSAADITTGAFYSSQWAAGDMGLETLVQTLHRFQPAECLLNEDNYNDAELLRLLKTHTEANLTRVAQWDEYASHADDSLKKHFNVGTLRGFGLSDEPYALQASAVLLRYMSQTQRGHIDHIKNLKRYEPTEYLLLDASTVSNLELFNSLHEGKQEGTLLWVLDETMTAMGGRTLRSWMKQPLSDIKQIASRLNLVDILSHRMSLVSRIRAELEPMYDIERLLARLSTGIGNAADVVNLATSLKIAVGLVGKLRNEHLPELNELLHTTPPSLAKVIHEIDTKLVDDPPIDTRGGGLIRDGVNPELDELRKIMNGGKDWVETFEAHEKNTTGISSLKVRYNKVFGYYIEISNSYLSTVPEHYIRKQTLVNAERFITPELKNYEHKILTAEERCMEIEYQLFRKIVDGILMFTNDIQMISALIGELDCLTDFAYIADLYHYNKPEIIKAGDLDIIDGRHPVVERLMEGRAFVPNSVLLDHLENQLHIVTGPNMAGKSVYMRQIAHITLMSHIGCFVPARKAIIPCTDRIFVRSGASDMITSGLSTFMVEMVEAARIVRNATPRSLIILDEIGRGTSTYDGMSIAWSIAEYLVTHWKNGPKTLFATHYHELQKLDEKFPHKISNYHMAVEEHNGTPIFLYQIVKGGASHSYGIAVAKLAGVPTEITEKAQKLLQSLEKKKTNTTISRDQQNKIISDLQNLDVEHMTPLEVMNWITALQKSLA